MPAAEAQPSAAGAVGRLSGRLERATGCQGWSVVGALTGLAALGAAMVGLYWDVASHVDAGRDERLFTGPHLVVVVGLAGLVVAAGVAVAMATLEGAAGGVRLGPLRLPWSALLLLAFRLGGTVAFFLDDLWHRAYGVDVTLWSPVHLTLLAGGSLSALALWLMLVEGSRGCRPRGWGRVLQVTTLGAVLVGLSTYQAEFDYGVPQFRIGFLPLLLAGAAAFGLVLARLSLGPGGAVAAAAAFVVLRSGVALLVGGPLDHTTPRLPLYVAPALCVEAVATVLGVDRALRFAVAAGTAVATAGLGLEWWWAVSVGHHHLSVGALPEAVVTALVAGVAAAVLATAVAAVVGGRPVGRAAPAVAGLALAVTVAWLAPVEVGRVEAVVRLGPGPASVVSAELSPPDAADGADLFDVVAVQGGGRVVADLDPAGPSRFVSARAVPVSGEWKTLLRLYRGDEVMAAPVHLPADPSVGASAVRITAERPVAFRSVADVLQPERHDGARSTAAVVYTSLAAVVAVWLALVVAALRRLPTGLAVEPAPSLWSGDGRVAARASEEVES